MTSIRRLAALTAALTLGAGLAACGSEDDPAAATGPASASATAASPAAHAFPVTIEHKFGATEIPQPPERVVVGYTELDTVLALGVVPVGTRAFLGGYDWTSRPWAQEALGDAEPPAVVGEEEINYEAVASQRPDLIIALNTGMTETDYERLSKIAPTIAQSGEYVDFGMPWEEQTMTIGRALGREDEAERVVADVSARFEQAREDHPEFAETTSVMAYGGPDGYGAYSTEDLRSRFLTDLGFTMSPKIDELAGDSFFVDLSKERFRLLDQELVVMYGPQDEIESDPAFSRSDAVKEDRVVYLDLGDDFAGAIGYASPLSLPWLLDEALPKLEAAADGDPSTPVEQPQ